MELALLLVSMAAVVLAATAVSDRLHVPAPLLLIVVGAAASYVPGVPTIHLESEVVLLGLLPPLLYAAAIQTSLVDFNANRGLDPPALGGPRGADVARGRGGRALAGARHRLGGRHRDRRGGRPTRRGRRDRGRRNGSGCHAGW